MTRTQAFVALALLAAVSACDDARSPTSPLRPSNLGPSRHIDDGAHGGNAYFFFLPPMVSKPSISSEFHPGLRPRVEICELNNVSCTPFKSFSASDVSVSVTDKHYQVNWDTKSPDVDPAKSYRIEVYLGDTRIGLADVDVVSNGSQLKTVDTQEYIALVDGRTLPIKFFLGHGVTCPNNPNGCAEYTVKGAEGGSFQSLDDRSATVIPAGASPFEEFTLTIEKITLQADASCHGAPRTTGVTLVKEYNDCYRYQTEPDVFEAGGFRDPTPGDDEFKRSDRVVVALCVDEAAAGDRRPFLQIFKSDAPPRPVYALEDAEQGVDFPVDLINCEGTIGALPPSPNSGLLAHLGYHARRLGATIVNFVTPRSAYAIDLGEGGFLGIGDGYSDFRWGVEGHLHPESPLTRSLPVGSTADFSVMLEAQTHHAGEGQESLAISGDNIQFTLVDPTGARLAPPLAATNADGIATAQFTLPSAGTYQVTARHANGGEPVTFAVTAFASVATPVSSSLQLFARSVANGTVATDDDPVSQGPTLNQLTSSVSARAVNGETTVNAVGQATATWQTPASGQVVFTDVGWTTVLQATASGTAELQNGSDWTYTFTANQTATLAIQYDIAWDARSTDSFGLRGFLVRFTPQGGSTQTYELLWPLSAFGFPDPMRGTLNLPVVAGTTYTLRIENDASITGGITTRTTLMDATFNWSIAVPPPIT